MSSLVNKKGVAALAPNLAERHVLAEILDRIISGEHEAVTISKIAGEIAVGTQVVREALLSLTSRGLIIINEEWENVGSFSPHSVQIKLEVEQLAASSLTKPIDTPKSREISGLDEISYGSDLYRATVRPQSSEDGVPTGWSILNVVRNPGLDGEFLVLDKEFRSADEAWQYWDEYKIGLADSPIEALSAWMRTLDGRGDTRDGDDGQPATIVALKSDAFALCVDVLSDRSQRELAEDDGEFCWEGRWYVLDDEEGHAMPDHVLKNPVEALPGDDGEKDEDSAEDPPFSDDSEAEPVQTTFTVKIDCDGEQKEVSIEYERGGVSELDTFRMKPSWDEAVWVKTCAQARVPTMQEALEAFALDLAQKHWDTHYKS